MDDYEVSCRRAAMELRKGKLDRLITILEGNREIPAHLREELVEILKTNSSTKFQLICKLRNAKPGRPRRSIAESSRDAYIGWHMEDLIKSGEKYEVALELTTDEFRHKFKIEKGTVKAAHTRLRKWIRENKK